MLDIPTESRSWRGGAIVESLLAQLANPTDRLLVCRHMIRAALDLFVFTIHLNKGLGRHPVREVTECPPFRWRVGHRDRSQLTYVFLPEINDQVLWKWQHKRTVETIWLIVPSTAEFLFQHALRDILKDRTPTIYSLDGFMSWRVSFASLDADWSHQKTLHWMFRRYNKIIQDLRLDCSLLVKLP